MKIKAKDGSVIDLEDIRKEQVFIGNPYAVDHAILIKHNIALLDALEAMLSIGFPIPEQNNMNSSLIRDGEYAMWRKMREAAGLIEDES